MTVDDMKALAAWHRENAARSREAAARMLSDAAAEFHGRADMHARWADQLEELASAFSTIAKLK